MALGVKAIAVAVAAMAVAVGSGVAVGVKAMAVAVAAMAVAVAGSGEAVGVAVANSGVAVGVAVAGSGVTVGVGVAVAHTVAETVFVSSVTAPFRARALPDTLAPVFMVMLVSARIFPTNVVVVPRVAELPTCQNTLQF